MIIIGYFLTLQKRFTECLARLGAQAQFSREYRSLLIAVKGTPLAGRPAREIFQAVDYAARALCLPRDSQARAIYAICQMIHTGWVSTELLHNQLGEALPGATLLAAQALNIEPIALTLKLINREILAVDFLPLFANTLREKFYDEWVRMNGLSA